MGEGKVVNFEGGRGEREKNEKGKLKGEGGGKF
jgi:hypothetical protein